MSPALSKEERGGPYISIQTSPSNLMGSQQYMSQVAGDSLGLMSISTESQREQRLQLPIELISLKQINGTLIFM